jgi:hypothetical protein
VGAVARVRRLAGPRLASADLVHAHMFGAWWAAAQVVPSRVPLVAGEHNAYNRPGEPRDHELRGALLRVDRPYAQGRRRGRTCSSRRSPGYGGRRT